MGPARRPPEPQGLSDQKTTGYTDRLTGLGNRHRLSDKVRQLAADRAADPAPFTVGIVNLDGFKPINDL
ncbi:MAG: diguanylate cyclase, partial [Pseudomonadota bacterium]|nr:diguanylate cyclase [Pseudomonadota bacterium]